MDKRTTSAGFQTKQALYTNQPRTLIEIALTGLTLYFTNDNVSINFPSSGGNTYYPWTFRCSLDVNEVNGSVGRATVRFDNVNTGTYAGNARNFFRNWVANYTFQGRTITIKKIFANEVDGSDDAMTLFAGTMQAPEMSGSEVSITACSAMYLLQRSFPARDFGNTCPWTFDSAECLGGKTYTASTLSFHENAPDSDTIEDSAGGFITAGMRPGMWVDIAGSSLNDGVCEISAVAAGVLTVLTDRADEAEGASITLTKTLAFATTGTLDAGTTATSLIDSARVEADDYWNDGRVTITDGVDAGLARPVKDFTNATHEIAPKYAFPQAPGTGDAYTVTRGCDKTSRCCKTRFNNFINFGGFPAVPERREGS